ncbi:hypothetical protein G7017_11040 [Pseudomonas fulva]|uniref:hypothetical protein n=1 Tax=Pseudomonas putida group TaxID=136845 RepID=UPI00104249A4|nr:MULTISPECIES: hypothetical protein [Pseudomonas putida group]MBA1221430.1 hypothetical protein [Pseudomonas fulva]MBH3452077.1 hypothetical protein [Pseudomonas putida]MDQ2486779.1 hypothetical protein [Pseudomonas putida]
MKNSAEEEYRKAFKRIIEGKPIRISKHAKLTLANIAREAGNDPSALKKSRYPTFIAEVEEYNSSPSPTVKRSDRSLTAQLTAARAENNALRERCTELAAERDIAHSKVLNLQLALIEKCQELEEYIGPSSIAVLDQHARKKHMERDDRDERP